MLPSLEAYERMIYSIPSEWDSVQRSTLTLIRYGASLATVRGDIAFSDGTVLRVAEMLNFAVGCIETYSYEILVEHEKVAWYDPQPHPEDPSLASTFPHHKHVPPDIKHNRVPAPGLPFGSPNLPSLIALITRSSDLTS